MGSGGSGTIFFTSCNLACVFCQNYDISQLRFGQTLKTHDLAQMMIVLQNMGCHNINLVSPTTHAPQILAALSSAIEKDLHLPLVYNTGGYDSLETLKLLNGIVDIYMPDIKYGDDKIGLKYSKAPGYWDVVRKAIKEMHRQVGDLVIENGLAKKGLLVRHLILPEKLAGTEKVMEFLAHNISKNTYVNIMTQYWPTNKAYLYPEINRRITQEEFKEAIAIAQSFGLHRFDKPLKS